MRSISSKIIYIFSLIAQKYSAKADLCGAFRQCHKPVPLDFISQRDSKLLHEVEASGWPVQDRAPEIAHHPESCDTNSMRSYVFVHLLAVISKTTT